MDFKTCKELQTLIKNGTGLRSVFVNAWEGTAYPPYIVVSEGKMQSVPADNKVYAKKRRFYISVFVKKSDTETVDEVEELLDDNDIYYDKEVYWLDDLRLECHEYEI